MNESGMPNGIVYRYRRMNMATAPTMTAELETPETELEELQLRVKQIKDLALDGVKEPTDGVGTLKKILSLLP
jgi:hypothetical protein